MDSENLLHLSIALPHLSSVIGVLIVADSLFLNYNVFFLGVVWGVLT